MKFLQEMIAKKRQAHAESPDPAPIAGDPEGSFVLPRISEPSGPASTLAPAQDGTPQDGCASIIPYRQRGAAQDGAANPAPVRD